MEKIEKLCQNQRFQEINLHKQGLYGVSRENDMTTAGNDINTKK